jgi:hypothetical protein
MIYDLQARHHRLLYYLIHPGELYLLVLFNANFLRHIINNITYTEQYTFKERYLYCLTEIYVVY